MLERELQIKSVAYRKAILRIIHQARAGHTGGCLSCIDIVNVLYNQVMNVSPDRVNDPDRDRYIQSKGHSVEALYTVLADCGFFPQEELATLGKYGTRLVGHPTRKVPGIEQNTGGLGHGLSVGVGLALAAKMDGRSYRTFVLLGDGELEEGSNWEAAMAAAHYGLDNLMIIVDRNRLQISGSTEKVIGLESLAAKFSAFGLAVHSCDGNDIHELVETFASLPFEQNKPNLLIAQTTKGKGVSFIEDAVQWHHKVPSDDELARALAELDKAAIQIEAGA